jgi:hypothetical protein
MVRRGRIADIDERLSATLSRDIYLAVVAQSAKAWDSRWRKGSFLATIWGYRRWYKNFRLTTKVSNTSLSRKFDTCLGHMSME